MAATPVTISITFVEVAVVTGGFLFIGQAPNTSAAQQLTLQLNTTGSAVNAALTTAVAAVFRTWLAGATSTYVSELTATLGLTAATIAASNTLQLGLFSSVQTQDVTVVNAVIEPNVTAALNANSSADAAQQNYAFNVTLQVAVLTADMLLSVFVDVLNSTSTGPTRRLLVSMSGLVADNLWSTSEQKRTPEASVSIKVPGQGVLPSVAVDGQLLTQQLGLRMLRPTSWADAATTLARHETHKAPDQAQRAQHAKGMGTPSDATSIMRGGDASSHPEAGAIQSLLFRHLLQSTASTAAFPLASLLFFKRNLVVAAFTSTSGCSTESIDELFYQGLGVPAALGTLCGGGSSAADHSLDAALLARSNSTVPLLQVIA